MKKKASMKILRKVPAKPAEATSKKANVKTPAKATPKIAKVKRPAKPALAGATGAKLPQRYVEALERVRAILSKSAGGEAKMLEICWLLNSKFPHYNWVGFYISTGNRELVLGPFVGEPTEHVRIPFGRGVCGQAAETRRTFVVDDVSKEPNYLSCSMYVRSEIVLPILVKGEIAGELDIDSHTPGAFAKEDREFLERLCREASSLF
jgi:GAF domain-containing protein